MVLVKHELKLNRKAFLIWTSAIAFFIVVCVFMFPEMKGEMDAVSDMFASMGSFTAAFGMDRLNFGTLIGFYAVECGNILGIGGAFFAALIGISALAKEEKDGTAEFLLTHPISRQRVLLEKGIAVFIQIIVMNVVISGLSIVSMMAIGEEVLWKEIFLMHAAYFLLQTELACICFGLSAFMRGSSMGAGIGIAVAFYFMNLVANITKDAEFLKYITPYGYTEGADIVSNGKLDIVLIALGMVYAAVCLAVGCWKYSRKDIR